MTKYTDLEVLSLFREFVIKNAVVWELGSNHHHPMWAMVAEQLEDVDDPPKSGPLWRFTQAGNRETLQELARKFLKELTGEERQEVDMKKNLIARRQAVNLLPRDIVEEIYSRHSLGAIEPHRLNAYHLRFAILDNWNEAIHQEVVRAVDQLMK